MLVVWYVRLILASISQLLSASSFNFSILFVPLAFVPRRRFHFTDAHLIGHWGVKEVIFVVRCREKFGRKTSWLLALRQTDRCLPLYWPQTNNMVLQSRIHLSVNVANQSARLSSRVFSWRDESKRLYSCVINWTKLSHYRGPLCHHGPCWLLALGTNKLNMNASLVSRLWFS